MRPASWILYTLAGLTLTAGPLAAVSMAQADELQLTTEPQGSAHRPTRGMSMEKVEATFGAPSNRVPAVGQPPITRWEYPGFVVYFEHQLVIHAVAVG